MNNLSGRKNDHQRHGIRHGGIPDVQGGVETHCQNLYPEIYRQGSAEVCVIARSPYVNYRRSEYQGVKLKSLWAPKSRKFEAIIHSALAAFSTLFDGSNVVHVHAVGPGLVVPLLRLLGKRVVFTHHGPDYDRQKWGRMAKEMLRLGEKWAVKYANEVIVISEVINNLIKHKHGRHNAHVIYNGVRQADLPPADRQAEILDKYGLKPGQYIVAVARFVGEKGLHDLVAAYAAAGCSVPLVLIGDADHADEYSERLKQQATATPNVILTGFISGAPLHTLFSQAGLFVLPSYHEGLPIALLEAMSWSLPVVVSDIPANLEIGLPPADYFPVGNVPGLTPETATMGRRRKSGLQPVYAKVPLAGNRRANRASLSALNVSRLLVPKSTAELVVERFYAALDQEVETLLTAEQKRGIEQALVRANLASRHRIDFRHSFPFLHRRYFVVFLFGRDLRKVSRESTLFGRIFATLLITLGVVFALLSILLALYMLKSALGIDVFKNFHVGIWTWFVNLHDHMTK